ncbi:hypothetical protein BDV96DRAFT_398853 [Lophiotrema nucula]|uniref:Uncharacterized protein n=1 Tax=Lophiotrema nucula TaxID=690887 RepID=A0A6A5ZDT5_9PLEO|nr:hypothetical protein BDV96DRAFT_398853 [Lophiotrema nucula]
MPYTIPYLPLTLTSSTAAHAAIVASESAPSAPPALDVPNSLRHPQRPSKGAVVVSQRTSDRPVPAFHSQLHPQRRAGDGKRQPADRRRSSLASRFPLLRKSSREVANGAPPAHIRGSSVSIQLTSPADSPFLSTGAPRGSSISSRGRSDRKSEELRTRESSIDPSIRSVSREPPTNDTSSIRSTTPLRSNASAASIRTVPADDDASDANLAQSRQKSVSTASAAPRAADKKMHQTSSRLLRMTDDERPFTRVSAVDLVFW